MIGRIVAASSVALLAALAVVVAPSSQPAAPDPAPVALVSNAPLPPGCRSEHVSLQMGAVGSTRLGALNIEQYWCWDGAKITRVDNPEVWTTKNSHVGSVFYRWSPTTVQTFDRDPQNGGHWTRKVVVTGTFDTCPIYKVACTYSNDYKATLYVFGDGVHHFEVQ